MHKATRRKNPVTVLIVGIVDVTIANISDGVTYKPVFIGLQTSRKKSFANILMLMFNEVTEDRPN